MNKTDLKAALLYFGKHVGAHPPMDIEIELMQMGLLNAVTLTPKGEEVLASLKRKQ